MLKDLSQSERRRARSLTRLHESCYPWFLAVAVVEEGQLPLLHLPHKIARLRSEVVAGERGREKGLRAILGRSGSTDLEIPNAVPAAGLVHHRLQILNPKLKGEPDLWVHSCTLEQSQGRRDTPSRRCRSRSGSRARTSSASGCAPAGRPLLHSPLIFQLLSFCHQQRLLPKRPFHHHRLCLVRKRPPLTTAGGICYHLLDLLTCICSFSGSFLRRHLFLTMESSMNEFNPPTTCATVVRYVNHSTKSFWTPHLCVALKWQLFCIF